ncbi:aminotransferase class V-fold PLP-dependent enzyme [Helcococcus ovis]|uniref:Aminotransferase class V-fold PLP-dependent enzyme n=2 Tax=Helcococcus ovis TaxID=72026 RepID=A0A4R9C2P0_9FIRM|nr:aminotransferase class V-fold PLP-dependent enzyme [Helcococcus ovis]TFF66201.1 aminotransferase class V-fold PLP-dependent enzyme [Helcococcus ovis]TFF67320.1 aminotransferase class V-fold PLP-dependent enzyme [Helcococcus ovis]
MKTYPLESMNLEEAIKKQHEFIDCISKVFKYNETLMAGDFGLNIKNNQPLFTRKVEKVFADFFNSESAVLVRGSGTGAIREALASILKPGDKILIHKSEIYSTTKNSFEMMGYIIVKADFNDLNNLKEVLHNNKDIKSCLIQYTRQEINDKYEMKDVIETIKNNSVDIKIITDDNYAVMKVKKVGTQLNANLSCFSLFKLLGPQGIGIVIGDKIFIDKIREFHYSGGSQVQGTEAMEAMRNFIYAPVQLAIQSIQIEKIYNRLKLGEINEVEDVVIANAQSKVILIKFKDKIAKKVLDIAGEYGAIPYPVGSESRYEIVPLFYRLSGTMRKTNGEYEDYWIRINPMKASADTVIKILKKSIEKVKNVFR